MKNRPTPLNINSAILSTTFQLFPLDYFGKRYCVFQEDAIMMQNTARRLTSVAVMATTFCVIIGVFCNLPQVTSLGSECYTITGVDYRGNQNKIDLPPDLTGAADLVQSTTCLPWNTSIESRKPRARERGIGPHDHCRNPDGDIIPWCKVPELPGTVGAWGYCHLPKCKVPGYIGCFLDKGEPAALDAVSILHKSMTVGSCLSFCRRKGYRYAGLEAGHACYCGNHGYDRYSSSAERGTHCATKCFGNKGQPCGGDGYVDVYHTYIGSCGQTLHDQHGAVYSPGYPDFPSSQGLVTSLTASDAMMIKLKEKSYRGLDLTADDNDEPGPAMKDAENPKKTCEWIIDVKHATAIKMLVRKIDAKQKLGGVIEIEAVDDAMIDITIPTRTFDMTSSNMTSPNVTQPNAFSGKSKVVWICDSLKARGEIDVIVPDNEINDRRSKRSEDQAENNLPKDSKPHWFEHLLKRKQGRYVIPYNSLEPLFTINSGRVIVRYIRSSDLLTSLKSTFDSKVHRSRNRKKTSSEWSRFVIEYEATLPVGMTINDISDDITKKDDVSQSKHNKNKHLKLHKPATEDRQSTDIRSRGKTSFTAQVSQDSIGKTRFTISQADAEAIKEAMTSKSERSESAGSESANSPIKIEVFVEPVAGDGSSTNGKNGNSKVMSEFTIPLLLAVLLTTTAILILSAVLLIFRRGGISLIKKQDKRHLPDYSSHGGLVVACQTPPHGRKDFGKSSSDSNLSSSSTADSLLLTESEGSKYSPNFTRDPTALKNLMEILKGHPGILQNRSQLDAEQYKQITQQAALLNFSSESALRPENRSDDVTPLPGPCPYCCGCPEENRVHRHGDSCRTHHKQSKTSSSIARGNKNPRNLTIRGCLKSSAGPQQGTAVAPPLSPISEVSSIASSMTSLPITSSNSQISLLARHTPTSQSGKHSHVWKNSKPAVDNPNLLNALETEAFLSPESDAESGVGDLRPPINESSIPLMNKSTKLRFSENISEKIVPGRYLGNGGGSGGCYDSGYATSNYEEEEEDKRNKSEIKKENKIFASSEGESEIPLENLLVS